MRFNLQKFVQFYFLFHNAMFPCSSRKMDSLKNVGLDEKHAWKNNTKNH